MTTIQSGAFESMDDPKKGMKVKHKGLGTRGEIEHIVGSNATIMFENGKKAKCWTWLLWEIYERIEVIEDDEIS